MNNHPRPMSLRKTVQLMVILTILAWATQTLFAQWGYSGVILDLNAVDPAAAPDRTADGAIIELRSRVTFTGEGKVALRDLCRWSRQDADMLEPFADTLITHLSDVAGVRQISVADVKARLHDAGANLSLLHFTGASQCAVIVGGDADDNAIEYVAETQTDAPVADPFAAAEPSIIIADDEAAPATRPADEQTLHFVEQFVLTRPLSRGQRIIASDVRAQRVQLADPTTRPTAIDIDEIVGNIAARDLETGEVFDIDDIARPAIVTAGQFMTVALKIGAIEVETVARSIDAAALGETVRAKNEATGEVYQVTVTGPNEGRVESPPDSTADDLAVIPQYD